MNSRDFDLEKEDLEPKKTLLEVCDGTHKTSMGA
jgi:hypothetical protein